MTDQGSHSASGEGHLAPSAVEIKGSRKEQLRHFSHLSLSHLYPKETDPGVRTEATIEISHLKFMQAFVSGNWLDSQIPFSCSPKGLLKELPYSASKSLNYPHAFCIVPPSVPYS